MKKVILGAVAMMVLSGSAFADILRVANDSIVMYAELGISWQDDEDVASKVFTFEDAVKYCKNLTIQGTPNWKMIEEDHVDAIAVHGQYFKNAYKNKANFLVLTKDGKPGYYNMNNSSMFGLYIKVENNKNAKHGVMCIQNMFDRRR